MQSNVISYSKRQIAIATNVNFGKKRFAQLKCRVVEALQLRLVLLAQD